MPQADFVVLTCALTPETTGLMSAAAFAAMKPLAYFVNVARGKVADEAALIATLQAGKIAGAALDVTARGAAAGRLAVVGSAQCLHHAAHRRRDARL